MKLNNKIILSLLVLFIAAISVSCVSAEDVATNDTVADTVAVDSVSEDVAVEGANIDYDNDVKIDAVVEDNVAAKTYDIPDGANASYIQEVVNNASAGDTISFAENGNYNFNDTEIINVDHTLNFVGNNATLNIRNGFYVIASETSSIAGTSFTGFNFVIPATPYVYVKNNETEESYGRAIDIRGGENIDINNCTFENGNAGVYLRGSVGNITVADCYFTGTTNATTIGTRDETGTKAVNIMGGTGITVKDNVFEGDVLDAISIASNAKNVLVTGNDISDAWYGIFYGGGLQNITTTNNIFNQTKVYGIGLVKAAQDSKIYNNTFILGNVTDEVDTSAAIYLEQGNTAHGAATRIGDIYIIDNEFLVANGTETETASRYAVEIVSQGGQLKLDGDLLIQNNTYGQDITKFIFIDNDWNANDGDINISQYTMDTTVTPASEDATLHFGDTLNIQLAGADGTILPNQLVTLTFTKGNTTITKNVTTDKFGVATFINDLEEGTYTVTASFAGATYNGGIYTASNAKFNVTSKYYKTIISGENMTVASKTGNRFEVVLKDENNMILVNKTAQITVNGVTYNRTSDENGVVGLNINLNKGEYNISVYYADESHEAANETYVLTAVQGKTTILSNITTITAKGQQFKAQLVDALGNPLSDQAIAFHINGRAYYKNTDENGFAYLTINLANEGIYNMFMSFDGTDVYAASTGGSQVTCDYN